MGQPAVAQQQTTFQGLELEQEALHRRVGSHAVSLERGPYEQSPTSKGVTSIDGKLNNKKESAAETMATTVGGTQSDGQVYLNTVQSNS